MSEPATSANTLAASLTGAGVAIFGPAFGPWVSILFGAVIGSLWSVGFAETTDRLHAGVVMARNALTACVLTGATAYFAMQYTDMPTEYLLPATAFAIGAWFDQARTALWSRIKEKIGGTGA